MPTPDEQPHPAPTPQDAASAAEFIAAMRALKQWTGLTYRQLQRRAEALDEVLPHSTIAAVLGRNTLPREGLVSTFVRACGADESSVAGWIAARKRIAASTDQPTPAPAEAGQRSPGHEPDAPDTIDRSADPEPPLETEATEPAGPVEQSRLGAPLDPVATDRPVVSTYATGSLAAVVAEQDSDQWVGRHRYDPAVEVPRPAGVRWLVPPIMYRTGWSTRVLSGVLVLILALISAGVIVKIFRDVRDDDADGLKKDASDSLLTDLDYLLEESPTPAPVTLPPTPKATPSKPPQTTGTKQDSAAGGKPQPGSGTGTGTGSGTTTAGAGTTIFAGRYRIHLAHTGLCVGEGRELFKPSGRTVLGQHPCADASPPTLLERVSGNTYRIKLDHPEYGIGCVTVDYGGTDDGTLLAGADCDSRRADQTFILEPVTAPAAGYRIHSVPGGNSRCIGVYGAHTQSGTQLIQETCQNGKHTVFTFQRG